MRYIISITLLLITFTGFAQTSEEELAAQYFLNEEYDKAQILYKKLHKKNPASVYTYQNYLDCLLQQKLVSDAEKMVAKQVKRFPYKPLYIVDLGYVQKLQGEDKKAEKLYISAINRAVDLVKSNPQGDGFAAEQLSSAFLKRDEYAHAKNCLTRTRKAVNSPTLFAQQLIDIYKRTGENEAIIDEVLSVLKHDQLKLPEAKANLISLVDANTKMDYLQERTATYLQKFPDLTVFDELLMWVFIQQKKFNSAFRQATAMDKRNKTEGKNLIDLAHTCLTNEAYDVSIKCFDKVAEFGTEGYFYMASQVGSLRAQYQKVFHHGTYTDADLNDLINRMNKMISVYGKNPNTAQTIKELSDIYIYHKHDVPKGIALLEEIVNMPRLQIKKRGEYKLALGDAYVMEDKVWDAALLYGQVDKEFKEDPLGQEAKFRNARLSYFRGDFEWATSQLDVLKTATSQLIANNALELSLLIKDNTGLDSSTDAMMAFAHVQLLLFQNRLDDCIKELNMLPFQYPNHSLEDEIYFAKAEVFEKQRQYEKAEEYYLNVVKYFGEDILADNALYRLGLLYENRLNQPKKALEMYESLIFDHNGSLFVVDARKRYQRLKKRFPEIDESKS
jgi:tetratricopeptide (TPR) repeat protein